MLTSLTQSFADAVLEAEKIIAGAPPGPAVAPVDGPTQPEPFHPAG